MNRAQDSAGDSSENNTLRTTMEEIYPRAPWRNVEDVEFTTASWVEWFNNRRLLTPIGDIPPVELEQMYYQAQEPVAEVAAVN